MKILVTGYNGRIGKQLIKLGCLPLVCDVTKHMEVASAVVKERPDLVVHLASRSDVDYCEAEKNRTEVLRVNYNGTLNVAKACESVKAGMVLLSTDHIFNGKKGPYRENYKYYMPNVLGQTEKPVNYYGLTKLGAEALQRVFPFMKIVRTSYNFEKRRIELLYQDYPTFMTRSFMYIPHFVDALKVYLDRFYEMPDILHISGSQTVSWYEFMLAYCSVYDIDKEKIVPRKKPYGVASKYAPRPHKAGLVTDLSAKLGLPQFSYIDGLKQMLKDEQS